MGTTYPTYSSCVPVRLVTYNFMLLVGEKMLMDEVRMYSQHCMHTKMQKSNNFPTSLLFLLKKQDELFYFG